MFHCKANIQKPISYRSEEEIESTISGRQINYNYKKRASERASDSFWDFFYTSIYNTAYNNSTNNGVGRSYVFFFSLRKEPWLGLTFGRFYRVPSWSSVKAGWDWDGRCSGSPYSTFHYWILWCVCIAYTPFSGSFGEQSVFYSVLQTVFYGVR